MLIHNRLSYNLQSLASTTATPPPSPPRSAKVIKENQEKEHIYHSEEKPFVMLSNAVRAKVAPTVKATSVNVIIDDVGTNPAPTFDAFEERNDQKHEAVSGNHEAIPLANAAVADQNGQAQYIPPIYRKEGPIRSASLSLSIELAKKTSMQSISSSTPSLISNSSQLKSDQQKQKSLQSTALASATGPVVNKSNSSRKAIASTANNINQKQHYRTITKTVDQEQRPASIASYTSNSILQRIAHSPKSAAANVYSTSVSANGNVIFDPHVSQTDHLQQQNDIEHQQLPQQQQQEKLEITDSFTEKKLYMRPTTTTTAAIESLLTNRIHYTPPSSPPNQHHNDHRTVAALGGDYPDENSLNRSNRLSSTITAAATPGHSSSASSTTTSEHDDNQYSPMPTCENRFTLAKESSYATASSVSVASTSAQSLRNMQTTVSIPLSNSENCRQKPNDTLQIDTMTTNKKSRNGNSSWWLSYFFSSKNQTTVKAENQYPKLNTDNTSYSQTEVGQKVPATTSQENKKVETVKISDTNVLTNDTKMCGDALQLDLTASSNPFSNKDALSFQDKREQQQTDSIRRARSVASLPTNIISPASIYATAMNKPHTKGGTVTSAALSIQTASTTTTSEQRQNITAMSPILSSSPTHSQFSTQSHQHQSSSSSTTATAQIKKSSLNSTSTSSAFPTTAVTIPTKNHKNEVLPPLSTLFHKRPVPPPSPAIKTPPLPTHTHPVNFITKIMDAINAVLIPSPPPRKQVYPQKAAKNEEDETYTTKHWIAKRMRAKLSHFIDDMKSTFGTSSTINPTEETAALKADATTVHAQPNTRQVSQTHGPESDSDGAAAASVAAKKIMNNKRIVIVGVHGWFPMKLVRSMIGEPTGTSIKFCEQMASGIKHYFQEEHGVELPIDDVITLVPLEGEGKVEDRVHQLYEKLLNNSLWLEAVSSADVVLWATHSQGTPVSMMLLHRLLERGHIHLIRQSVCVLAMAGISQGPFPALKGSLIVKYFEADAARELFEFMDSSSSISVQFRASLVYILNRGVKVVLTGSMQDQVVPLYSAIMTSIDHPNLLRSVYIDGHLLTEKNDFLIHLVVFAVKLRNLGLSDHDLVVHLSEVLAGSLYALEGGHSTIYEELKVYMTAVRYIFETAPFGQCVRTTAVAAAAEQQQVVEQKELEEEGKEASLSSFVAKQQRNPFYLPWVLHSIMTDPQILANDSLLQDLKLLLRLFEHWHPTSARLKELKYRLDPIRTVKL